MMAIKKHLKSLQEQPITKDISNGSPSFKISAFMTREQLTRENVCFWKARSCKINENQQYALVM